MARSTNTELIDADNSLFNKILQRILFFFDCLQYLDQYLDAKIIRL
jgi:hypothetical protein